LIVVLVY